MPSFHEEASQLAAGGGLSRAEEPYHHDLIGFPGDLNLMAFATQESCQFLIDDMDEMLLLGEASWCILLADPFLYRAAQGKDKFHIHVCLEERSLDVLYKLIHKLVIDEYCMGYLVERVLEGLPEFFKHHWLHRMNYGI